MRFDFKIMTCLFFAAGALHNLSATTFNGSVELKKTQLEKAEANGSSNFTDCQFTYLTINGSLDFKELRVRELLKVSGSLKGQNLTAYNVETSGSFSGNNLKIFGNLKVSGSLSGNRIQVQGITRLSGGLNVKNSSFQTLDLNCEKIHLFNSMAQKVIFRKVSHNKVQKLLNFVHKTMSVLKNQDSQMIYKEVLSLKGDSKISGDVIFESGQGIVELGPNASILGKVKGGQVIKMEHE